MTFADLFSMAAMLLIKRTFRFLTAVEMVEDTPPIARSDVPTCAIQALTSALILAIGSSLGGYLLFILGLPLTIVGFIVACRAALNWSSPDRTNSFTWITALLTAMAALGIVGPTTGGLIWYEVIKRTFAVASIVLVGVFSSEDLTRRRRAAWLAVSAGLVLFALGPIGAPHPPIDVFTWTQTSVQALLHRTNPYTVVAPDVYLGRYDPGYTVSVYPYMPATLLAYAPWVSVLGDFRFALAACLALTIALIHHIGRRLRVTPQMTYAAVLAIVLHPSSPRMVESGWTEPLLVFGAALFVYFALDNPKGIGQAATFLLLPALKQIRRRADGSVPHSRPSIRAASRVHRSGGDRCSNRAAISDLELAGDAGRHGVSNGSADGPATRVDVTGGVNGDDIGCVSGTLDERRRAADRRRNRVVASEGFTG